MIDEIRGIYRELYRLVKAAGHGTQSRIQSAAGVSGSYLRDLRPRLETGQIKGYDLGALLPMLEALGVDRGLFFGRVFGSHGPIALCQLEVRQLGELPGVIIKVRDRLLLEPWQPLAEVPESILELDAHRYQDANEAREIARGELIKVGAGLGDLSWGVPLLGVYGSALRMTDDYDRAQQALVTALEVAEPTGDRSILGDLLRRLAYVVADRRADYRRALALAKEATDYYFLTSDLNSAGKTLVDRGLWLYKLDRPGESIEMQHRALEYLKDSEHLHRCTALHGLGIYHWQLGDLGHAQEYSRRARELAPHLGDLMVAKLSWLDARIAIDRERYGTAEELLRKTIQGFVSTSPFEAARATVELVRVFVLQNQHDAAREIAATMAQFIGPLEQQSTVAARTAVSLMAHAASSRRLPLAEVDRVFAVLKKERECSGKPSRSKP